MAFRRVNLRLFYILLLSTKAISIFLSFFFKCLSKLLEPYNMLNKLAKIPFIIRLKFIGH